MFNVYHIHPMLVHFPIALTLLGCLLECIAYFRKKKSKCGEIILYFATFSGVLAVIAGGLFTPNFTETTLAQAKNIHSTVAGATLTLLCVTTIFYIGSHIFYKYRQMLHTIGIIIYIVASIAISLTGYLGGILVYNDMLKM